MGAIEEKRIEVDDDNYQNALGFGIPGTDKTGLGFVQPWELGVPAGRAGALDFGKTIPETIEKTKASTEKNKI